jgi:dihydropteroate synthase
MGGHCDFHYNVHTGPVRDNVMDGVLNCAGRRLDLSGGAVIMGILNTTPDSFYDGGALHSGSDSGGVDLERALDCALGMIGAGASIIDIGGESSRPGAEKISEQEEIARTAPLIALLRQRSDILISIDTYKAGVAEAALQAGAHMVNDISGFTFDRQLPAICRKYQAGVVLMHTPIKPESMQWSTGTESGGKDIVTRVRLFLARSIAVAEEHGIEEIVIDPGFGFGKSVEENFRLLDQLDSLLPLGRPILAGVSRKSFLGHAITPPGGVMVPPSDRLPATIAAQTIALMRGATILRVHDVQAATQCAAIVHAIQTP